MKYYAGLDVSLKETFVSIMDETGKIVEENVSVSDVECVHQYLQKTGLPFEKIGIESGQLSIYLCKGLREKGWLVVCMDARHAAKALSARSNKNDKNDARGLAHLLRTNLYKEVEIKSDVTCEQKVLLGARLQIAHVRQQLMGTVRGLLKIYGIKIGSQSDFIKKVRIHIQKISPLIKASIEQLLINIDSLESSLEILNQELVHISKQDKTCQRLMSVPGVGPVTAVVYKASIDNPYRFEHSQTVGAYLGLTPRQYSSGEINRQGSISKMGPKQTRSMLYEAAHVLLTRSKAPSALKKWGVKLAKKKGMRKAVVAVARKMAVILHKIWINNTEFAKAAETAV